MAENIITPRRREDFFDKNGNPTLRFVRWIEAVTGNTNISSNDVTEIQAALTEFDDIHAPDLTEIEDALTEFDDIHMPNVEDEIQNNLTEFDDISTTIVQDEIHSDVISTATSLTTSGTQTIICTAAVTITLNASPDDQEIATVVIQNGDVTIEGNGRNVMGDTDVTVIFLNLQSDATLDLKYILETNEWVAI